ncbi:MAG: hypothetical protein QOF61_1283 [Acidobacteriota bacterium]|nr:hypothetical protein [Acidobacteriota bacterium]
MAASIENYVPQIAPRRSASRRAVCAWLLSSTVALLFVALLFAAPVLESSGHAAGAWVIYHSFAPLCHQIAERSFYVAGHPLAVCARCTGVYAGFAACLWLYPLVRPLRRTDAPRRAWLLVAIAPTSVDFLINFTGLAHNTHLSRLLTGAWLGAGAVFFVLPGLVEIAETYRRDRTADPSRALFKSQVSRVGV